MFICHLFLEKCYLYQFIFFSKIHSQIKFIILKNIYYVISEKNLGGKTFSLFSRAPCSIPRSVQTRPFRFRQSPLSPFPISVSRIPNFLKEFLSLTAFLRHYPVSVPGLIGRIPVELFTDRLPPPPAEYQS
jgi:hypothetical protein